jgi:spermidine synthase
LLIDAFDHEDMAQSLCNAEFFQACQAILKQDGLLVINLWGGAHNPQFQRIAYWLRLSFSMRVLFLPVKDRGNVIGIAFNSTAPRWQFQQLRDNAIELEQLYNIDFTGFLRDLKKNNASAFPRIVKV